MATPSQRGAGVPFGGVPGAEHVDPADEALFAALTRGAQSAPESRILDRLVGTWSMEGRWDPTARGIELRPSGRSENRWIMAGRVVEACGFDDEGRATSTVLYAWDVSRANYVAFSISVLSTNFELEHGTHDPASDTLTFLGTEQMRQGGPTVAYARTIRFLADGSHELSISYPEADDPSAGGMVNHYRSRP